MRVLLLERHGTTKDLSEFPKRALAVMIKK